MASHLAVTAPPKQVREHQWLFLSSSPPKNSRDVSALTAAAASTSKQKPSLVYLVNFEKDPKHIAETFKKACQTETFRQNLTVYQDTVSRLGQEVRTDRGDPRGAEQHVKARIYGRAGMFENAQKVFDEMLDRNCKRLLPAFNALSRSSIWLKACSRRCQVNSRSKPDIRSYNALVKGLCRKGSLPEAVALLDEIENKGL
ncbi:hypothetical protein F2Q70_00023518 [Brassica cretica]|uniref:Pentacotripeptide-repeat region of PRORP domain-containing protein n=1 Tax=Brassica cretica TaxID=69181 RepID=A0A8S9GLZ3_BRACR|nr:hypothetical protein F2Q70_00023518 [Brassica cretica]